MYGLPPDPVVTTRDLGGIVARRAALAAAALGATVAAAALGGRRCRAAREARHGPAGASRAPTTGGR